VDLLLGADSPAIKEVGQGGGARMSGWGSGEGGAAEPLLGSNARMAVRIGMGSS
jgi:hypothetical protein